MSFNYDTEAKKLAPIFDFIIDAIEKFPPEGWTPQNISQTLKFNREMKEDILQPAAEFRNEKSLKITKRNILNMFQEGTGKYVEYFWEQVEKNGMSEEVVRVNPIESILKKGKISNAVELEIAQAYLKGGKVNVLLSEYIEKFEQKKKGRKA
ncbi:hypothetical protein [Chitinophaga sp. LS1]|uniref:hypothetical protein n=1 Tax=Chitinophaga sp. LS1 TaxID=3051176 RepID=UPI002AAB5117|nr:hypothetical protein [Chitinophaga sp. LS1]WPV64687.1 hypothetical protein QQL36_23065 [Chitinophaga sp. LS1]